MLSEQRLISPKGSIRSQPQKTSDLVEIKKLIFGSKFHILLLTIPVAFYSYYAHWTPMWVFIFNFLAMIPCANILGNATECCAEHLGETAGGLLNATFGNAVEIVVMVMALLRAKETDSEATKLALLTVTQTSLIGSVFSNSLLVLGCAFLANGVRYKEGTFNTSATSANLTLLMIAGFTMMLPGPYISAVDGSDEDALLISRVAAVILLIMYFCLLYFELFTHKDLIEGTENATNIIPLPKCKQIDIRNYQVSDDSFAENNKLVEISEISDDSDDEDELQLSMLTAIVILLIATIMLSVLSDYLVGAIEPTAHKLGISEAFIGIILIPIVGNAVEQMTAIRVAAKGKMDIAMSIAIGSACQVAMFAVSTAVLFAWALDLNLSLAFDSFEQQIFLFSALIIFAMINDGKSNWFRGMMLLCMYALIGLSFIFGIDSCFFICCLLILRLF